MGTNAAHGESGLCSSCEPTRLTLGDCSGISSDGEKSELLINILRRKLLTNQTARDAFMKITRSISSDGEYRRVMEEAITADRR